MIFGGILRRKAIEALLEGVGVPKECRGKVAEAVNKLMEEHMEPRTGLKTSEFWVHAALTLGALFASLEGTVPPKYALAAILVSGCFYSIARGLAKTGSTGAVGGVTVEASTTPGARTVVVAAPSATEVSR